MACNATELGTRGVAPGTKVGYRTEGVGAWTVAMETEAKLTSWSEEGSKQHRGRTWCLPLAFVLLGAACEWSRKKGVV